MSKACVTQMTRALALEWATHDIRVNAISPRMVSNANQ
jgi:2-deoxy-D-gluconate 3-dehydrogenase